MAPRVVIMTTTAAFRCDNYAGITNSLSFQCRNPANNELTNLFILFKNENMWTWINFYQYLSAVNFCQHFSAVSHNYMWNWAMFRWALSNPLYAFVVTTCNVIITCIYIDFGARCRYIVQGWVITCHSKLGCVITHPCPIYLWPLLLTWFNFNPSMDK